MQTKLRLDKNRNNIAVIFIIYLLLCVVVLFHFSKLNGFIDKHEGWAGPHHLSVSVNLDAESNYFRHDVRYSNDTLKPYNHHPPLFFFIQSALIDDTTEAAKRLNTAYKLAAIFVCLGFLAIHLLLNRLGFSVLVSSIASISALSTQLWLVHQPLTTFDCANVFLSAMLIYFLVLILQTPNRKNYFKFFCAGCAATLISWYAILIIFTCGLWFLWLQWQRQRLREFWSQPEFLTCISTSLFASILLLTLIFEEALTIGNTISLEKSFNNSLFLLENFSESIRSDSQMREIKVVPIIKSILATISSPILILMLAIAIYFGFGKSLSLVANNIQQTRMRLTVIFLPALGTTLFIICTIYWSSTHNFAFLWYIPPLAIVTAILLEVWEQNSHRALIVVLCLSLFYYMFEISDRSADALKQQKLRRPILTWLSLQTNLKPIAWVLPKDSEFPAPCGKYSGGALIFIGSKPNVFVKESMNIPADYRKLEMLCDSTLERPEVKFRDAEGIIVFIDG